VPGDDKDFPCASHVATRLRRADEVSAGKNIRVTSDARPSDGGRRSPKACAQVG
jgi:hypothetical protein